jgi:hypothetical protein
MDLETYRVGKLPDTVYYIPNILSLSEEALLMDKIGKSPKKQNGPSSATGFKNVFFQRE